MDLFNRLLLSSDPLLSTICYRNLPKLKKSLNDPEANNLLLTGENQDESSCYYIIFIIYLISQFPTTRTIINLLLYYRSIPTRGRRWRLLLRRGGRRRRWWCWWNKWRKLRWKYIILQICINIYIGFCILFLLLLSRFFLIIIYMQKNYNCLHLNVLYACLTRNATQTSCKSEFTMKISFAI